MEGVMMASKAELEAFVSEHARRAKYGNRYMIPDCDNVPEGISDALTRAFGRPTVPDRGEVAYWIFGRREMDACELNVELDWDA
jgi:hypothetical protein